MQLMHKMRIQSRGDSQIKPKNLLFFSLLSAMIFQGTPLPEMSMHRKKSA